MDIDPLADTVLTEASTVRMRRDVLAELVEKTQPIKTPTQSNTHESAGPVSRTSEVWHSRLGAWLRELVFMAPQSLADRALNRKRKAAWSGIIEDNLGDVRTYRAKRERMLEDIVAAARESHVAATQHRDTSHAFILQRIVGDAERLGRVVNKKLREGRLNHTEAGLVDQESYFEADDWLHYLTF